MTVAAPDAHQPRDDPAAAPLVEKATPVCRTASEVDRVARPTGRLNEPRPL
jgi:hypothetical protein